MTSIQVCAHEHVEQIGSTPEGEMITECMRCGSSDDRTAVQIVANTKRADVVKLINALDKIPSAHMNDDVRAAWATAKREAWLQLEAHDAGIKATVAAAYAKVMR